MELVFRIERNDDGPYWQMDYSLRPKWMHGHNASEMHPRPVEDFLQFPTNDRNLIFGFEYEHQLYSWFEPEAREWLRDNEFKCYVYEADEYTMRTGKFQCAFQKDTATRIKEIPL